MKIEYIRADMKESTVVAAAAAVIHNIIRLCTI